MQEENKENIVKKACKELGVTQKELAETAKLTIGHVSALETGRRDPSLRVLGVIAAAIGLFLYADGYFDKKDSVEMQIGPAKIEIEGQ